MRGSVTSRLARLFLAAPQRLRVRAAPGWRAETGAELGRILGVSAPAVVKRDSSISSRNIPQGKDNVAKSLHSDKESFTIAEDDVNGSSKVQMSGLDSKKYKFSPSLREVEGSRPHWGVLNIDMRQAMDLVVKTRTALDVRWVVVDAKCESHSELKKLMHSVPFEIFFSCIDPADVPAIVQSVLSARARSSFANSSQMLFEAFEDALSSFASSYRAGNESVTRPSSPQPRLDMLNFGVVLERNRLEITADLGGHALYKRGYKQNLSATAPLPEHHAAAAFEWLQKWSSQLHTKKAPCKRSHIVHIPFAGSGTLGFEAALALLRIPPGAAPRTSHSYGYEHFAAAPEPTLRYIRDKCAAYKNNFWCDQSGDSVEIRFSDINSEVVDNLHGNMDSFGRAFFPNFNQNEGITERKRYVASARLEDFFEMHCTDTNSTDSLGSKSSELHYLLLNPPRGLRLGKNTDPDSLYARIGDRVATVAKELVAARRRLIGYCIIPDETSWKAFCGHVVKGGVVKVLQTRHFTQGGEDVRIVAFAAAPKSNA